MTLSELLTESDYTPRKPWLAPAPGGAEWRALPCAARLIAAGEEVLRASRVPPPLPLSLWLRFSASGDRSAHEEPYFARRRALCALAMAECASGEGRFLDAIADYAWAICEETAWQLPAHNSYVRDATQLPLPDPARPVIDLFAAETGALLATLRALLGERLDILAPGLSARLRDAVRSRVLAPYLTEHFWWMADTDQPQDTPTCNWMPWCTQNVLLAAAALLPSEELKPYVAKAARGLDRFMSEYGEDGCCNEGAQYYGHAALTLWGALELLCGIAPGVFEPIWAEPKLRNMAEYIVHMHVAEPWYLNFADCSPLAGRRGAREYRFAMRVNSEPLRALSALDFAATLREGSGKVATNSDGISLWERIQSAFAEEEMLDAARRLDGALPAAPNVWYPSAGVLCARRGPYVLGAKAGNNADSHNHNDVGSVILYKDGRPLLIDVGVESYTRKTFSPRRYEIWTMQSSWHNLPEFDPSGAAYQQLPGADARAADVAVDEDRCGISMDIAPAYGEVPGLGRYRRRGRLEADGLRMEDETDYPGAVALSLMSAEKPAFDGAVLRFGALAAATVAGAERVEIEPIPIRDPRLRAAWPETLYRTRIYFTQSLTLELR